jgi:DNA-binding Xre family transcriptional regulator
MKSNNVFSQNLKYLMEKKDITAIDLSKETDISSSSISLFLNDKKQYNQTHLEKISEVLNCSCSDLINPFIRFNTTNKFDKSFIIENINKLYNFISAGKNDITEALIDKDIEISGKQYTLSVTLKIKERRKI